MDALNQGAGNSVDDGSLPTVYDIDPGVKRELRAKVEADAHAHHPGQLAISLYKFSNVAFSCATASLFRTFVFGQKSTPQETPIDRGSVPSWLKAEFQKETASKGYMRRYLRDTGLLIGVSYLMDGVEAGLEAVRGTKDQYNKMVGGAAAGSVLGFPWYRGQPSVCVMLAGTGALVGYLSHNAEITSRRLLLEQQHKLEQELLGLPPQIQKQELDTVYLQELLRIRQKQQAESGNSNLDQHKAKLQQMLHPRQHANDRAKVPESLREQEKSLQTGPPSTGSTWGDEFSESDFDKATRLDQPPDFADERPQGEST